MNKQKIISGIVGLVGGTFLASNAFALEGKITKQEGCFSCDPPKYSIEFNTQDYKYRLEVKGNELKTTQTWIPPGKPIHTSRSDDKIPQVGLFYLLKHPIGIVPMDSGAYPASIPLKDPMRTIKYEFGGEKIFLPNSDLHPLVNGVQIDFYLPSAYGKERELFGGHFDGPDGWT